MPDRLRRPFLMLALAGLLPFGLPAPVMAEDNAGAYLAARVAGANRDFREAAMWFNRALLGDPANPAILEGAVLSHLSIGEVDKAAAIARQLQQTGINSQSAFMALIAEQAMKDDFAGIVADARAGRSVGRLFDGLSVAWAELGTGRMSEAIEAFDAVATADGLRIFGLYHKALALASAGDFEGAEAILSSPEAEALTGVRRAVIAHAQILSQLERNPEAVERINAVFIPGQEPGMDALRARLEAGEPVPFDIARDAREGIAEVYFTLATALNGEADNSFTLLHSQVAAYLRPDHVEAHLMSAGLLSLQGQYQLASETYARVPPGDPTFHVAEMGRADALYASDKKEAAVEVLQALARSHGQLISVQKALGDMLRREERYAEAVPAYDAAIAAASATESPEDWVLYYARAICHERLKDWEKAEPDFRKALELNPDQPQVLNYLGYSFLEMNTNLDEALAMIQTAVERQPDAGYIVDSLAWAYFRLGRYQDALEPMERASVLEPVDPIVTDHLGDVYWAVGRKLEARFQWRRALSFNPEEKDAERIRRKLEAGLDAVLAEEGAPPLTPVATAGNGN
ncbi:tetratricopeptide repeat protein [Aliigemmobacter aestuarii]|uniref:Tetratricopeptide repeat protein n=1 Tax=Aliigemmobacter aestuarii TaxID=1445661 RepID=A0A4S3MNG5_9RHOB|nr:tetratricopeptide repeat protein [Gemmobacter aestuarii]THD83554.1 tetratricopeptide repeat protein [Gemmobacter aestuarii]